MSRASTISKTLPAAVKQVLLQLGRNIRIARLRRHLRLQDLAERVGVSRYLMSDIEKGKPTAAIAAYVGALWALGLSDDLSRVADPDNDEEGKAFENARAPKTAAKRKKVLDNDF
ncbi:MAG: helix-turn-helix domain-containing protein [Gammaproteobacteria bacterium]|nr:helix-turn-helix domain-containing protein [Gammaproteobacteria bacterium]